MAEDVTKTSIDTLVEYLKEHGETDTSTLAKTLGVSETLIEEWSNILERSNIVKINYKAGKMYVAPLAVTKGGFEEAQHSIEIEKENIINEATAQLDEINKLNEKIENLSKVISSGNEILKKKMGPLKEELDELYKISNIAEKRYNEVKERKKEVDTIAERLNKELDGLRERASSIERFSIDTANAKKLIQDIQNKIELMQKTLEEEIENRKKAFEMLEKNEKAIVESIKNEINAIREMIIASEREINEAQRLEMQYKKDAITLRRKLDETGKKAIADISKDKEEIEKYYNFLDKKYTELKLKIEDVKKSIGDITTINETLKEAQNSIENINKRKEPLQKELNEIIQEAKSIDALAREDIITGTKKVNELKDKTSKSRSKLGEINKMVSDTDENIEDLMK
jgi:chromosome segregation ATPase